MLNVPPCATVNEPSKSPPLQFNTTLEETIKELLIVPEKFITALAETVKGPLIVTPEKFATTPGFSVPLKVPPENVALSDTKPLPVQLAMLKAPVKVVTVPPSLSNFQPMVVEPVPPVFWSVPTL